MGCILPGAQATSYRVFESHNMFRGGKYLMDKISALAKSSKGYELMSIQLAHRWLAGDIFLDCGP